MSFRLQSRADLCQLLSVHVIAIVLAGCGGVTTTSPSDPGASDASTGCPSIPDINKKATLGKACASEGTYCTDPSCDPCVQNCPAVRCTGGTWKTAINTALCTGDAATACPSIDGSSFDRSCQMDSDCVSVVAGTFCPDGPACLCGRDVINVQDQDNYNAKLQPLIDSQADASGPACMCPAFGAPRCINSRCVLCGGASPACPDGG